MTSVFREDGTLKPVWSFDSETYLLNPTLASPPVVCGSFASNAFPAPIRERIEAAGPSRGLIKELSGGITTALVDADLYVTCMAIAVSLAWTSRLDGDEALCFVAHNAPYDIATLLQRARLQDATDTTEVDYFKPAAALGLRQDDATFELVLHCMLIDIMDVEGTGLPSSPSHVFDTSIREKLIRIAAGDEPERDTSLAACVKKYIGEDRSDDKKGPPCARCHTKKRVPETYLGCNRRACDRYGTPQKGEHCEGSYNDLRCERALKTKTRKVECSACNGRGYHVPWRLRYSELDGVPLDEWPEKAVMYAIGDAVDALLVLEAQGGEGLNDYDPSGEHVVVDSRGAVQDECHQTRAGWSLKLAQMSGPRADASYYKEYVKQHEENICKAFAIGKEMGFIRSNGTRDTAVHQTLVSDAYARLGKEPPLTPTGRVSTTEDTVRQSGDDRLMKYQEYTEKDYTKVIALGVEQALAADPGVLKATGRTSWKMYMHQPPRKGIFRECWTPRKGNVFLSCDWTAAEMVALSQILVIMFGESAMADAINEGKDLHKLLGVSIWNADPKNIEQIDYAEFDRRYREGDKSIKEIRQFAKVGNFGFPGGLRSLVDYARGMGIILTDELSDRVRKAWMETWFQMPRYLDGFSEEDRANQGYGFTYLQWVTGRIRGRVRYTNGCNTGFQGLVADAMKMAMWWSIREMYTPLWGGQQSTTIDYPHAPGDPWRSRSIETSLPRRGEESPLYGWRAWLWIHDEGLLEGPEEEAHEAGARFSSLMEWALAYFTPDLKTEALPALMRRWYKDAEPEYVEGRLVPWEPESGS